MGNAGPWSKAIIFFEIVPPIENNLLEDILKRKHRTLTKMTVPREVPGPALL